MAGAGTEACALTELVIRLGREQRGPELAEHVRCMLQPLHQLRTVLQHSSCDSHISQEQRGGVRGCTRTPSQNRNNKPRSLEDSTKNSVYSTAYRAHGTQVGTTRPVLRDRNQRCGSFQLHSVRNATTVARQGTNAEPSKHLRHTEVLRRPLMTVLSGTTGCRYRKLTSDRFIWKDCFFTTLSASSNSRSCSPSIASVGRSSPQFSLSPNRRPLRLSRDPAPAAHEDSERAVARNVRTIAHRHGKHSQKCGSPSNQGALATHTTTLRPVLAMPKRQRRAD